MHYCSCTFTFLIEVISRCFVFRVTLVTTFSPQLAYCSYKDICCLYMFGIQPLIEPSLVLICILIFLNATVCAFS